MSAHLEDVAVSVKADTLVKILLRTTELVEDYTYLINKRHPDDDISEQRRLDRELANARALVELLSEFTNERGYALGLAESALGVRPRVS